MIRATVVPAVIDPRVIEGPYRPILLPSRRVDPELFGHGARAVPAASVTAEDPLHHPHNPPPRLPVPERRYAAALPSARVYPLDGRRDC